MVGVIGKYSQGSQVLGEAHHCLVDVFLWELFPDGLQGNFRLISRLGFGWSLWYFLVIWLRRDSPADSNQWTRNSSLSSVWC